MIDLGLISRTSRAIRARTAIWALSLVFVFGGLTSDARAQATYTADRINGFSAFGGVSYLNTDYGATDTGYLFGADFTHSVGVRYIVPSLEVRYNGSTGPAITENSFLAGLKVETKFHKLRPYATALIGYGQIHYVRVGQGDDSIAYDFGVGADYNIYGPFAIKIDAQEQFWKLGQATNALTPQIVSVGILYRIPSGFLRRSR